MYNCRLLIVSTVQSKARAELIVRRFRDVFKRCWCVEMGKKKGNLSGPIKVCEENYTRTQKKKTFGMRLDSSLVL